MENEKYASYACECNELEERARFWCIYEWKRKIPILFYRSFYIISSSISFITYYNTCRILYNWPYFIDVDISCTYYCICVLSYRKASNKPEIHEIFVCLSGSFCSLYRSYSYLHVFLVVYRNTKIYLQR